MTTTTSTRASRCRTPRWPFALKLLRAEAPRFERSSQRRDAGPSSPSPPPPARRGRPVPLQRGPHPDGDKGRPPQRWHSDAVAKHWPRSQLMQQQH